MPATAEVSVMAIMKATYSQAMTTICMRMRENAGRMSNDTVKPGVCPIAPLHCRHLSTALLEPFKRIRAGRDTKCSRIVLHDLPDRFGNINRMRHQTVVVLKSR